MADISTQPTIAGVCLVDKPVGPSSFRMVQLVRRAFGIKKVGHSGTLDPFASGLLIICVGRPATRMIPQLMGGDKVYEAVLRLGVETDTFDREGKVTARSEVVVPADNELDACLRSFCGRQMQAPPAFSALKHKGKPLYYYARKGIVVEKEPREVVIHDIRCLRLDETSLAIRVHCGKGTYIRTLAMDIGRALGCGAHLTELRRLQNGPFSVENAVNGALLDERDRARELLASSMLSVDRAEEVLAAQHD